MFKPKGPTTLSAVLFLLMTACGVLHAPASDSSVETRTEALGDTAASVKPWSAFPAPRGEPIPMKEQVKQEQAAPACETGGAAEKRVYVNVAVATLWREPNAHRPLDEPAILAPADVKGWTKRMTVQDKLWLVGKLETQALYGQQVKPLAEKGEWVKVVVPGQPTSRHPEGYPGWMPKRQLVESADFSRFEGCPVAVIKVKSTMLFDDAAEREPFLEISFDTRLPVIAVEERHFVVATPNAGEKRLRKSDALLRKPGEQAEKPAGEQLVETAKMFLGLPYLWAGVSGFGFDCSGFTYTLHRHYGIEIPRDAADQAKQGQAVRKNEWMPGDLLFFAYDNGKGKVHHVGMYAGNGQMIHSPKSERSVETIPVDTPEYAIEYAGARRYLTK